MAQTPLLRKEGTAILCHSLSSPSLPLTLFPTHPPSEAIVVPVGFGPCGENDNPGIAAYALLDAVGFQEPIQQDALKVADPADLFFPVSFEDAANVGAGTGIKKFVEFGGTEIEPEREPSAVLKVGIAGKDGCEEADQVGIAFVRVSSNMSQLVSHDKRALEIQQAITNDGFLRKWIKDAVDAGHMEPETREYGLLQAVRRGPILSVNDGDDPGHSPGGFIANPRFVIWSFLLFQIELVDLG